MLTTDILTPRSVVTDGTEVTYYDSCDPRNHPDDVLVLVHGTGGSTASHFGFLFPVLAAKQRVVSIDWSAPHIENRDLELDDLVSQVIGVIEAVLPARRVVLLGYSLGAVVTTVVAARRPDIVERLIVVAGWLHTDTQQLLRNDVWQALRSRLDDTALREYTMYCAFGGPFLATKTRDDLRSGLAEMTFSEFGDQQMALNRQIDIAVEAENVSAPTLVVSCTEDQMVPTRHQLALFGAIENSRYVEIPTGHAVVTERPAELSHHIQRFMDAPDEYAPGAIIATPRP